QLNRRSGAQVWRPAELDAFADHVRGIEGAAVLVDCSASEAVADRYAGWLAAGLHVVTPNKLAGSGPLARWRAIREAASVGGARWRYEATVGAGLPVIQTLRDLLDTGDALHAIEGMFSGTLAWLCNRHDGTAPFSALLREACAQGYTEPDPREDLSGTDVARKLVILAREAGWPLSLDEVEVESLVPPSLASLPTDAFMQRLARGGLAELDAPLAARLAQARAAGGVLRHVASLDVRGHARVRLEVVPAHHPFAHTQLTDNIVQLRTARYCDNPLIVQGPGAGPQVTAAGVFADVLRIAEAQGARA
ncbi:homoserine dehydrogenase, partial [Frateuria sp.]|uniref:homoserine dehydrogenase n=1 Tax=Frateuria sp. TaxID=2211372 RepID=UPI00185044BB